MSLLSFLFGNAKAPMLPRSVPGLGQPTPLRSSVPYPAVQTPSGPFAKLIGSTGRVSPPNPNPAGVVVPMPAPPGVLASTTMERIAGGVMTEAGDRALPFGPGAGRRLGPTIAGGSQLIG